MSFLVGQCLMRADKQLGPTALQVNSSLQKGRFSPALKEVMVYPLPKRWIQQYWMIFVQFPFFPLGKVVVEGGRPIAL